MKSIVTTMPMKRRLWLAAPMFAFFLAGQVFAQGFAYKTAKDFKTLEHFDTVEAFEASFAGYVQKCFDSTGGGTGGIACYDVPYQMWDRELNIYYGRLMKELKPKQQALLKENQKQWLAFRDNAMAINSALLNRHYDTPGTMYLLMRAGDTSRMIVPVVRQRALMLRDELELATKEPMSKDESQ